MVEEKKHALRVEMNVSIVRKIEKTMLDRIVWVVDMTVLVAN